MFDDNKTRRFTTDKVDPQSFCLGAELGVVSDQSQFFLLQNVSLLAIKSINGTKYSTNLKDFLLEDDSCCFLQFFSLKYRK